jgi:hypothetical protein
MAPKLDSMNTLIPLNLPNPNLDLMTKPLSPAAQTILDALYTDDTELAAAVLEAAADQVVPVELHPQIYEDCCQYSDVQTRAGIRRKLLAIAAELKTL